MAYLFLTACRNEEAILHEFLAEFTEVMRGAGVAADMVLYVVDDLSTDRTVEILERYRAQPGGIPLEIIRAPTNFGNQGALFHALSQIEVCSDDVLITFDCDGEDDVRQLPSIIALGADNPGKLVLIERGRRLESLGFRVAFASYKLLFRYLTRQTIIPNNFLLIPGRYVPFVQRTPLAAVHFAYATLRLGFPSVTTQRDRRQRYGGRSSQNLFMVASHGLVGLMVFYETVIAKLLLHLMLFGVFALGVAGLALAIPPNLGAQRTLFWVSVAMAGAGAAFFSLLMAAALALLFKIVVFSLTRVAAAAPAAPTRRRATGSEAPRGVPSETDDRRAS
jgi:glycosyltransferase involved in cell wall biosynthesis